MCRHSFYLTSQLLLSLSSAPSTLGHSPSLLSVLIPSVSRGDTGDPGLARQSSLSPWSAVWLRVGQVTALQPIRCQATFSGVSTCHFHHKKDYLAPWSSSHVPFPSVTRTSLKMNSWPSRANEHLLWGRCQSNGRESLCFQSGLPSWSVCTQSYCHLSYLSDKGNLPIEQKRTGKEMEREKCPGW